MYGVLNAMSATEKTYPIRLSDPALRSCLPPNRGKESGATLVSGVRSRLAQQVRVSTDLAAAKEALLAYAATYPDNYGDMQGPGYLPCPDTNNNGSPNPPCGQDAIGRLPDSVKTDVDDLAPFRKEEVFNASALRDSAGQRFWYALSPNFRNNPKLAAGLNSETLPQLILDGASSAEDKVVAVIIAPGVELASQDRSRFPNDVAHYLEGDNSSVGDKSFVSADSSIDFNDRVIAITHAELMSVVEKRVLGAVSQSLGDYKTNYGDGVSYPWLSPFADPKTDQLLGVAGGASNSTTLVDTQVNFIDLGVRVGDVLGNETDGSLGVISAVFQNSVAVTSLVGGTSNTFSDGDDYRIARFNGVIDVSEGLLPFHALGEPFKTSYVVEWNLQNTNGIAVSASGGMAEYANALENFVESSTWSGPVEVSIDDGICVWTDKASAGVKCAGYFDLPYFEGGTSKSHTAELEDSTRHFDAWGVVSGAKVTNVSDGSTGIVASVNDDTLVLESALVGGTNNLFSVGDTYRVTMPGDSTTPAIMDLISGPFLIDFEADHVALGIEVGDSIYNQTRDDWGLITGVGPNVLTVSGVAFDNGDSYFIRHHFIATREYKFIFSYNGLATKYGVNGSKRRDVCSNDGPAESGGNACTLTGVVSAANVLSMSDSSVSDFSTAGVKVGDMVININDQNSRGLVNAISANQLSVNSLNGGSTNQFLVGDSYEIYLTENLNDDPSLDPTNDDWASISITDRDHGGNVVGSASAEVPATGSAVASIAIDDLHTDLEVQLDATDTDYDLPFWFTDNQWHRLIYVAASSAALPGTLGACSVGTDCLAVVGLTPHDDIELVVIAAGAPLPTQDRASGTICGALEPPFLCDYFEGENADFDFDEAGAPPPTFEHTPKSDAFNDQLKTLARNN